MEPTFSEFSYGYAVTEELATGILGLLKGHPMFPSLKQEGQGGGGYDVMLPLIGAPLYLQFKRSHYMKRVYAEHWDLFNASYYRMYLMSSKYSMQHELLIHLELSGNEVYYIAPEFHEDEELTDYYTQRNTFNHSALFSPSDMGHFPDDDRHYVAFSHNATAYFCSSEPKELKRQLPGRSFSESYYSTYSTRTREIDRVFFDKLIENEMEVLREQNINTSKLRDSRNATIDIETIGDKARFAGFLTRAYFDAELFIIGQ